MAETPPKKTLKCVCLVETTVEEEIKACEEAKTLGADIVELRLDLIPEFKAEQLDALKTGITLPAIVALRPEWEGGAFKGTEDERLAILGAAVKAKFAYVDFEQKIDPEKLKGLIDACKENDVAPIVSYHDFEKTPLADEILEQVKKCIMPGVKLAKAAYMTKAFEDLVEIFEAAGALKEEKAEFVLLGMGTFGRETRIHSPLIGSRIVYTSVSRLKETVKGQIDIKSLVRKWELLEYA